MADHEANILTRRNLLVAAATSSILRGAHAQQSVPEGNRLAFRVVREDSEIGTHVLTFARSSHGLDIDIAVDLAVGFGPLTLFRYTLRGLEQWCDGVIHHVEASTNDNGAQESMRADRDSSGLWVEGSRIARYLAPADALPASHWNMAELRAPWINLQSGQLLRPTVQCVGTSPVALPNGRTEPATEYALSGDAKLNLWYGPDRQWLTLRFVAKDGSRVRYELT